jgi:hypothetical protein
MLSWSFIHEENSQVEVGGGAAGADARGTQKTYVNTTAELGEDIPTDGTNGSLFVNIGWTGSGSYWAYTPYQRSINMYVSFGAASLHIYTGEWLGEDYIIAEGTDGYGNSFFKTSDSPLSAATGSLGIGGDEFTSPLSAGNLATIRCADSAQPVTSSAGDDMCMNCDVMEAGIFQGLIAITAE